MDHTPESQTAEPAREDRATASSAALRPGGTFSSNREIAVVQADYLALTNDLEQAQALATALEIQLSGKTNELARFKVIWERTQADLTKFEHDINALRRERHAFSNEAQRALALENQIEKLKGAQEELRARNERLEGELLRERAAHQDSRTEIERLQVLVEARGTAANGRGARTQPDAELRRSLEGLRDQLDRILASPNGNTPARPQAATDHINIEFEA